MDHNKNSLNSNDKVVDSVAFSIELKGNLKFEDFGFGKLDYDRMLNIEN